MTTLKNIAVAVATIVIFTNITQAQAVKARYSVNYEEPMAIKYLGNDGEYLSFQVSVQPSVSGSAFFEVSDKLEGSLYATSLAPNFKVQTIKIEKRDDQVLNFKLVVGKRIYTKSFSINTSEVETTTVLETDITRL